MAGSIDKFVIDLGFVKQYGVEIGNLLEVRLKEGAMFNAQAMVNTYHAPEKYTDQPSSKKLCGYVIEMNETGITLTQGFDENVSDVAEPGHTGGTCVDYGAMRSIKGLKQDD